MYLPLSSLCSFSSSVFLEQTGGGDEATGEAITIKVKEHTGEEMQFKVKKSTRMEKIFEAYAGELSYRNHQVGII